MNDPKKKIAEIREALERAEGKYTVGTIADSWCRFLLSELERKDEVIEEQKRQLFYKSQEITELREKSWQDQQWFKQASANITEMQKELDRLEREYAEERAAHNQRIGVETVYISYDEESNVIDRIEATSMHISAEDKFAKRDSEGYITESSDVLSLTIGGKTMVHVGSSVVIHEKGLVNVFEEYAKTVDVTNTDRATPFLNKMVNDMRNLTTGQEYIILIRSQSGQPLATFVGDDVSYFATEVNKSTGLLIDGKRLFIYRCDYSIVPLEFLQ